MIFNILSCLYLLVLTSHALQPKYSTWMLESIISRSEGINPADGLLGVIQKGLFQESLHAVIQRSTDAAQIAKWSAYHRQSVDTNIGDLLNASASSRHLSLDRLCIGRSILEAHLDTPLHRQTLKSLRRSLDLQYRNENSGFWYFVDPPPPYEAYGNLSYSDGMYAFAPFATLYGFIYGDESTNLDTALRQLQLLYENSVQASTGLILHGYDASRGAPWADPMTGASPILWGRSLAWYMIGVVDTLEIVDRLSPSKDRKIKMEEVFQGILDIFQRLAHGTVRMILDSTRVTGRYAIWQVMDRPGEPGNFVEASASAMISFALAKGVRLGYLSGETGHQELFLQNDVQLKEHFWGAKVMSVARALYQDVLDHFVVEDEENGSLQFHGTSIIASLHEEKLDYEYYTHRAVMTNSLIGTSAFVLSSLEMEH
ncbi:putative glycosyl hydrolase family 88 [Aspergillus glaucus CBS 516.65]|uniref:Uncharacterized protein n=1 Tax=Aspergillus glaucus CBS 516.65 TaxID=1160497 RepID=A0A1L9V3L7_ASPGL|nr:hypothetical protein ASPGLDRAFT_78157 [Aspergillus glaucus CBS 516.65]OJJ78520.1 hypothetical protein ASPGLDRAFT_78157 [Aspergillus glaucus CBS 516.65]